MPKITNREGAEAYFKTQQQQRVVALAARSALRALPGLGAATDEDLGWIALPVFRATLTSAVSAVSPTAEVTTAAESAASAARTAANSAVYAASAARSAAHAALSAARSVLSTNDSAALSADSAALSAAFSALSEDTITRNLWHHPLWGDQAPRDWRTLFDKIGGDDWIFWRRWYQGFLDGHPLDRELQQRVALIPDEDWRKGAAHVAGIISDILRDRQGDALDQDKLRAHLARVVQAPTVHADAAEAIAEQLDAAIKRYCDEAPANGLPEGFEPFERVPRVFRAIAKILLQNNAKDARIEALQAQVNELYSTIAQLQVELAETRGRLAERRLTAEEARNTRRLGAILRENIAVTATIGALVFTALPFFGMKAEDFPYQPLRDDFIGAADEMSKVQSAEALRDRSEKVGDDHAQLPADAPPDSAPQTSTRPESRPETSPRTSKRPEPRPKF